MRTRSALPCGRDRRPVWSPVTCTSRPCTGRSSRPARPPAPETRRPLRLPNPPPRWRLESCATLRCPLLIYELSGAKLRACARTSRSVRWHRAVWGQLVDDLRQSLRQLLCEILRIHAQLRRHRIDRLRPKRLMHLVRGNRLIWSVVDPGLDRRPESLLLQLRDDALHAAVLLDQAIDDGDHLRADRAAQNTVE